MGSGESAWTVESACSAKDDAVTNTLPDDAPLQAAAVSGGRLLAVFTMQMDASDSITDFPIIYTMGSVANGALQPHNVRAAQLSQVNVQSCCRVPVDTSST